MFTSLFSRLKYICSLRLQSQLLVRQKNAHRCRPPPGERSWWTNLISNTTFCRKCSEKIQYIIWPASWLNELKRVKSLDYHRKAHRKVHWHLVRESMPCPGYSWGQSCFRVGPVDMHGRKLRGSTESRSCSPVWRLTDRCPAATPGADRWNTSSCSFILQRTFPAAVLSGRGCKQSEHRVPHRSLGGSMFCAWRGDTPSLHSCRARDPPAETTNYSRLPLTQRSPKDRFPSILFQRKVKEEKTLQPAVVNSGSILGGHGKTSIRNCAQWTWPRN